MRFPRREMRIAGTRRGSLTALLLTWSCLASAGSADAPTPDTQLMEFVTFVPCKGNASFCAPTILARGEIDAGAASRLEVHLKEFDFAPTIVFDSPGGSLTAGLELGILIREKGLSTSVAPSYSKEVFSEDKSSSSLEIISAHPVCYSACAYAFMGGQSRTIEPGARLGVHQFYGATQNGEASAQSTVAVLSQYLLRMGIDRELLDLASLTQADGISEVTPAQARTYNLDNQNPELAPWGLVALDTGDTVVRVEQQQGGGDRTVRIVFSRASSRDDLLRVFVGYGPVGALLAGGAVPDLAGSQNELEASICATGLGCARLIADEKWTYDSSTDSVLASFWVDPLALAKVATSAGDLSFQCGLPQALSQFSADTRLGRQGLRNALLVLLK
jgi:hypothetical protein